MENFLTVTTKQVQCMQHISPCIFPCLSGKSLQMENFLTIKLCMHATYTSPCTYLSPVSLENTYKWKISLQHSLCMQHTSQCITPLPLWKILTKLNFLTIKLCMQHVTLHVSFPCLSGKSLQMENFLTIKLCKRHNYSYLSTYPSPVPLKNPYKWKISLQHSACNIPVHVSLLCLSGKYIQMENFLPTKQCMQHIPLHIFLPYLFGKYLQN